MFIGGVRLQFDILMGVVSGLLEVRLYSRSVEVGPERGSGLADAQFGLDQWSDSW